MNWMRRHVRSMDAAMARGQGGLPDPGDVLDEQVTFSENAGKRLLHHVVLSSDDAGDVVGQALITLDESIEAAGVSHRPSFLRIFRRGRVLGRLALRAASSSAQNSRNCSSGDWESVGGSGRSRGRRRRGRRRRGWWGGGWWGGVGGVTWWGVGGVEVGGVEVGGVPDGGPKSRVVVVPRYRYETATSRLPGLPQSPGRTKVNEKGGEAPASEKGDECDGPVETAHGPPGSLGSFAETVQSSPAAGGAVPSNATITWAGQTAASGSQRGRPGRAELVSRLATEAEVRGERG